MVDPEQQLDVPRASPVLPECEWENALCAFTLGCAVFLNVFHDFSLWILANFSKFPILSICWFVTV